MALYTGTSGLQFEWNASWRKCQDIPCRFYIVWWLHGQRVNPLGLFQVCIKYNNSIKSNITPYKESPSLRNQKYCLNLNLSLIYCTEWSTCHKIKLTIKYDCNQPETKLWFQNGKLLKPILALNLTLLPLHCKLNAAISLWSLSIKCLNQKWMFMLPNHGLILNCWSQLWTPSAITYQWLEWMLTY